MSSSVSSSPSDSAVENSETETESEHEQNMKPDILWRKPPYKKIEAIGSM